MKTIQPIILSYNQPDETDKIHVKLTQDGFTNVIVVDNGSDKVPPAKSANLLLPRNIRATGQIKMALIYCMDYFPSDYYWLITTSAVLREDTNYAQKIQQAFDDLTGINVAVLSPSLDGPKAMPIQKYSGSPAHPYSISFRQELVASLVSHSVLEECRSKSKAHFEKSFTRGWGCDYELFHEAVLNNSWGVIDHAMVVGWESNAGYKKNVGGEDIHSYFDLANKEMEETLIRKYGSNWHRMMYYTYRRRVSKLKFSYHIDKTPDDYAFKDYIWKRAFKKISRWLKP